MYLCSQTTTVGFDLKRGVSPLLSLTSNIFGQGGEALFWDYSILKKPYSLALILKKPYSLACLAHHAVRVML